jgi:hypothetical protein
MASEKVIYWAVLGVLAMAVTNGFVNQHRGWAGRLADKSVAMAEHASKVAASYANPEAPDLQNDVQNDDLNRIVSAQVRLAGVQSSLARRQAQVIRVQVEGVRTRAMEQRIRALAACPRQDLVIAVPQPPQIFEAGTF